MSTGAEEFLFASWFEYLANVTTLLVNAGLIAAAIWAWRHWSKFGAILERAEQLLRELVAALREHTRALLKSTQTPSPPPPEPAAQAQPGSTTESQVVADNPQTLPAQQPRQSDSIRPQVPGPMLSATAAADSVARAHPSTDVLSHPVQRTSSLPTSPHQQSPASLEPVSVSRPGCLGYFLVLVVLVLLAVLFRSMTPQARVSTGSPPTETVAPPAPPNPPAPAAPQSQTQANWDYITRAGDSCWAIARRAAGDDIAETRRLWLAIVELNRDVCPPDRRLVMKPGVVLQMPAAVPRE